MSRRRGVRPALLRLLAASAALAWVLDAGADGPARPEASPCSHGVLVADELWCDADLELLGRACGGLPPAGARLSAPPTCAVLGRMEPADQQALAIPVDVNRGTLEDLESLPGIGPTLARRVIAGRPYADLDDLLRVRGVGPKRLSALRARARVAPGG